MPDRPDALMIFAAGLGTRMGTLTRECPKPLLPVAGRTLLDHALTIAREASIPRIVVNTHHFADLIAAHLREQGVGISHEPVLLDTGGGLRTALPLLGGGPVFTLNSDAVWTGPNPLEALRESWRDGMQALLLLVPRRRARGHLGPGDFRLGSDGRLGRGTDYVFTGAQIIRPGRLAEISLDVFSIRLLWEKLAESGGIHGIVHPGGWCDVGHPGGIAEAEAMLAEG